MTGKGSFGLSQFPYLVMEAFHYTGGVNNLSSQREPSIET